MSGYYELHSTLNFTALFGDGTALSWHLERKQLFLTTYFTPQLDDD